MTTKSREIIVANPTSHSSSLSGNTAGHTIEFQSKGPVRKDGREAQANDGSDESEGDTLGEQLIVLINAYETV